jgi:hypothetical protein
VVGFLLRRHALSPTAPLTANPRALMMQVGLVCLVSMQSQAFVCVAAVSTTSQRHPTAPLAANPTAVMMQVGLVCYIIFLFP